MFQLIVYCKFQCRTGRIVFKLFGKDPNDLPLALRTQVFPYFSSSFVYFIRFCIVPSNWWYDYVKIILEIPDPQLVVSQSYRHGKLY